MDELLKEFLAESNEQIEAASAQIIAFEHNPSDTALIGSIFRLVHTIKGTCGFLGLDRLQHLTHAAENLIGCLREGSTATLEIVSAILASIDRIKEILDGLETAEVEPEGDDSDLIDNLGILVAACKGGTSAPAKAEAAPAPTASEPAPAAPALVVSEPAAPTAAAPDPTPDRRVGDRRSPAPNAEAHDSANGGRRAETIRINLNVLERIMNLVSELVLTRNQLIELTRPQEDESLKSPLQRLSSLTSDLQDAVMRARMQPVEKVFANLPRLIRDLANDLHKKINLVTEGADTELDRQLIELIRDPLTHMVRNCADHGIETPEERARAGKPETGTIKVSAAHEAGQITIEIADDGRGLNLPRIREKALALGLTTAQDLERMSEEEVSRFIFAPGFSTATQVTNVSGRGVGMDVVRENIEMIGGSIALATNTGMGSRISLKIPLTLAIAPALIVETGGHRIAVPQHAVVEAVGIGEASEYKIETVQGAQILQLRDSVLPVTSLSKLLQLPPSENAAKEGEQLAVIMRVGVQTFGVTVDAVADVQEIVVKPLGASLSHLKAFSGHTILGDGTVVLIIDPAGVSAALGLEQSRDLGSADAQVVESATNEATRLVLFRAGGGVDKVLPLSVIARIETVAAGGIEQSNGMLIMRHQGRLMPVVAVSPEVCVKEGDNNVFVIAPNGEPFGLLIDEIVDIIQADLDVQIAGECPGLIGTADIDNKVVELVDIAYFVEMATGSMHAKAEGQRNVLLIEPAAFFRDMIAATLQASGRKVTKAATSAEALALVAGPDRFDAVLIAADMPGASGFELAGSLRAAGLKAPTIALAAHPTPDVADAAAAAGMVGAVGKFHRPRMLELIEDCVSDHRRDSGDDAYLVGAAA